MRFALRSLCGTWLAIGLLGCTALQPVRDGTFATLRREIHVGDRIEATVDGSHYQLVVTRIDDKNIHGIGGLGDDSQTTVTLPLAGVSRVAVRRFSLVETAEMTAAVIVMSIAFVLSTCASGVSCF